MSSSGLRATMVEFRDALHEWARRQLEDHSDHTAPFQIVSVRVDHDWPSSISSEQVNVDIEFTHDQSKCTYPTSDGSPCRITYWSPLSGTTETVKLINELLAIADEPI